MVMSCSEWPTAVTSVANHHGALETHPVKDKYMYWYVEGRRKEEFRKTKPRLLKLSVMTVPAYGWCTVRGNR